MSSVSKARWSVLAAGILWSTSGFFSKALSESTWLDLSEPPISPLQIAFFRALFAGLALAPTLPGQSFRFRPLVGGMMACFAAMNVLFICAMTGGTAANAILLQYTAPLWVLIVGVAFLHERFNNRDITLLVGGLGGIAVIIVGNWSDTELVAILYALGSGFTYAGVLLCLRQLRELPSNWLTALNLFGSAFVLVPFVLTMQSPTWQQMIWLALFGSVQLAIPYWLMARSLRHLPPFEAGLLTLIEPVLNPLWAFLISPATEVPSRWTLIGGVLILAALAFRYLPRRTGTNYRSNVE